VNARAGRIGPNAITRVAEAMLPQLGAVATARIFASAGLLDYLERPPESMVDEAEVTRLHRAMRAAVGPVQARALAFEAGTRTGDYLLAHRIPKPVQWLLRHLPATLAAPVLLSAIRRHAWTFAGSGVFTAQAGPPVRLTLRHNPLCAGITSDEPVCSFYSASFERLFRVLVHPRAQVRETACEAAGAAACAFEIRW
jgi:divinyl protochlorophyllide a 8-vinyl-reductase